MFIIKIKEIYADDLLIKAGYISHHKGDGYVRDLDAFRRFHAHIQGNLIKIHLDYTNRFNRHYVKRYPQLEKDELNMLHKVRAGMDCRVITPLTPKTKIPEQKLPENIRDIIRQVGIENSKKSYKCWANWLKWLS